VRQVWDAAEQDWIFLPAAGRWQRKASATNSDRLASLQAEFAAALDEMKRQAERAHKLETKARPRGPPQLSHSCTHPSSSGAMLELVAAHLHCKSGASCRYMVQATNSNDFRLSVLSVCAL